MSNNFASKKMVSIIIPTFNRRELVEFTLYSLFEQTVPAGDYEVIVVDGGSTDDTSHFLSALKTPYRLKVVSYKPNHGAAYSRNQGVKAARGEIIIFLDEMLVDENYIANHLKRHSRDKMVITSAYNGQSIFTHYFNQFMPAIKNECLRLRELPAAGWYPTKKENVFRLFRPDQVIDHSVLKYGITEGGGLLLYEQLIKMHGPLLQRMTFPWMLSITNSLSMQRSLMEKAGLFDENMPKTGLEDLELGYRLFLAGAIFQNGEEINSYHQNHPTGHDFKNILTNYLYFARKYPATEVLLCGLFCLPMSLLPFHQWVIGVSQYKILCSQDAATYPELIKAFYDLALAIGRLAQELLQGNYHPPLANPFEGFARWDFPFRNKVEEQFNLLAADAAMWETYGVFIKSFICLLRLPILKLDAWDE